MRSSNSHCAQLLMACFLLLVTVSPAQTPAAPKKPPVETPEARLLSARSVVVVHARGNAIPFDVIKSTVEGWVRFTVVETPEKADLIIEVATSGNSDTRGSASDGPSMLAGRPERSSSTERDISDSQITMTVYDAKSRRMLWTANQTARYAMKQTTRENNLVEASEKLASKFHDRLEPPAPKGRD